MWIISLFIFCFSCVLLYFLHLLLLLFYLVDMWLYSGPCHSNSCHAEGIYCWTSYGVSNKFKKPPLDGRMLPGYSSGIRYNLVYNWFFFFKLKQWYTDIRIVWFSLYWLFFYFLFLNSFMNTTSINTINEEFNVLKSWEIMTHILWHNNIALLFSSRDIYHPVIVKYI